MIFFALDRRQEQTRPNSQRQVEEEYQKYGDVQTTGHTRREEREAIGYKRSKRIDELQATLLACLPEVILLHNTRFYLP